MMKFFATLVGKGRDDKLTNHLHLLIFMLDVKLDLCSHLPGQRSSSNAFGYSIAPQSTLEDVNGR